MIKEKIRQIFEKYEDEEVGDILQSDLDNFEEDLSKMFEENKIKYKTNTEDMFDSCGLDIHSYTICWIENDEIKILVYRTVSY